MRSIREYQASKDSHARALGVNAMALFAAMTVAACGADTELPVPPAEAVVATETLLATADTGYSKIRFHEITDAQGNGAIFMSEEAPNTYTRTPLEIAIHKGYTNLELFTVLFPGQTAAPSLVASHPREALELGRPTADVVAVPFDKDAAIEKSLASCAAFVLEDVPDTACTIYTWGNGRRIDNTSGNKALHVGQTWSYATTKNVTMGVCNDSNVTIKGRIGVDLGGDSSSAYSFNGWANISAGTAWRWYNFASINTDVVCTEFNGDTCIAFSTIEFPSRYRVEGSSAAGKIYHVKTAERQVSPTGACGVP